MPEDKKNISRHILPTASDMLGLSFVIFSLVKANKCPENTFFDEVVAFSMVFFLISSLFPYASIRGRSHSDKYERIADVFSLGGLVAITLITEVFTFEII